MPPFLTYQNLDLEIEAYGADYRAHVITSPVGQVDWTVFRLPFSAQQVQVARQLFTGVRHLRSSTEHTPLLDPKGFGRQLYEAVFAGEIGRCLSRSLAKMDDTIGLRIRLRLNNAPDLADLPWEMLYGPVPFDFFALSARTPIVRYLAVPVAEAALTATLPLRILVVIANPATPDAPALDVETEWGKLHTALAALQEKRQVVLERLASPTLAALRARLRTSLDKPAIHLLHFIGHGETGALVFENEQGAPALIAAETLGILLHDHATLKLAFLNACEGGRNDNRDIFLGVAPELVRRGLPAVIAMKYAISDRAAIGLAAEFYQALADGYPVDAALAEARKALYVNGQGVEWGTPLLFSRSAENRLFAAATQAPPPNPAQAQTTIHTQGGAAFTGAIHPGEDFVGRDKITINNYYSAPVAPPVTQIARALTAAEMPRQDFEPETVLIPAGPFWMGSDDGAAHERPRHQVTLAAYRMGKYPITNHEYAEFARAHAEHSPQRAGWRFTNPPPNKAKHPVTGVSWQSALAYCDWLSQASCRRYRLPSEAEWEKAARGQDDARRYPWGDQWLADRCNQGGSDTTAVDAHALGVSPFGCYDLVGNVRQWTLSIWGDSPTVSSFPYPYKLDKQREARSPRGAVYRIWRGGAYDDPPALLGCSVRSFYSPEANLRNLGFRVLLEL